MKAEAVQRAASSCSRYNQFLSDFDGTRAVLDDQTNVSVTPFSGVVLVFDGELRWRFCVKVSASAVSVRCSVLSRLL